MNLDLLASICIYAFASSITPGPNNLMVMANGTNFGFRRTLPQITGIVLGFGLMLVVTGLGLSVVFKSYPLIEQALKIVSIAFLIFLAYRVARSSGGDKVEASQGPISFSQAILFQWVNPKAWAMTLTAIALFSPSGSFAAVTLMALCFMLVMIPCVGAWSYAGQKLQRFLSEPKRLKYFNFVMAALLLSCLGFMF